MTNSIAMQRRCLFTLAALLLAPSLRDAQTPDRHSRLRGTVVDAVTGKPSQKASVRILGSTSIAVTGDDGHFAISDGPVGLYNIEAHHSDQGRGVADKVDLHAGVESEVTIKISRNALLGNALISSASVSPISARKLPFAVDRLNAEELPVPSLLSAISSLEGKVSGLWMAPASGWPAAALALQLRTPVSLSDSGGPLLVVDGTMLSGDFPLSTLDIEALDVANIEIIKGAAAATLYGFRGMRGAIVVTTKRGRQASFGRPIFSFRNELGNNYLENLTDPVLAHP